MFDFDCPNFDQYENEKYQHQIFKYYNLTSSSNELKMLSINDMSLFRKDMIITQDPNEPPTKRDSKFRIKQPFPIPNKEKKDQFIFRIMFKPETG